jgi:tape measure domain-containing protein
MSDFNVKILEVKDLLKDVNTLLDTQKKSLDNVSASLSKYGGKVPSEFLNAQKKSIELGKEQTDIQKKIEQSAKNQTTVMQKLTKEELSYVNAVERGIKSKERDILANKKLSDAYGQLTTKRNESARALQNLIASEKASNSEIRKAQKEFDVLNKKVASADKAIGKLSQANNGIGKLTSGVSNLMGAFGIATGLGLAAGIVTNIYENTKALQSLDLALKMVSETQEKYAANTAFITSISEKWGLEIKSTTEQFTKFYADAKGKLSEAQIKETFEGIAKAGSIMGLSLEKQQSAFTAFQQMLSKGTIQAQELKLQLGDALPGSIKVATAAYQKLHPELKVTEALLYKHMEQGKLISSEMIPEMVKGYQKLYGIENVDGIKTLVAEQNRLANSWTELVRVMSVADTDTVFGQTLVGMTTIARGLLNVLTKIISSQKQITEGDKSEGQQRAMSLISSNPIAQEVEQYGGKTKESQKAFLTKQMNDNYNEWKASAEKYDELAREFNEKSAGGQYLAFDLKARMEGSAENIGYFKELYKQYKSFLNPEKKPDASVIGETADQKKVREKADKDRRDAEEKHLKDLYDLKMAQLEKDKIILEEGLDNEKLNYSEKLHLAFEISAKEMEIAQALYAEEQRLSKGNDEKLKIADINFWKEKEKLAKDSVKRINDIKYKPQYKDANKVADEETFGSGVFETDPAKLAEMKALWDKQQDEKDDIADKEKERLKAMSKVFNEFVGEFANKVGFGDTFDFLAEQDKHGKTMFENMINGSLTAEEKMKASFLAISTAAQDAFNMISEASNARYEKEFSNLEKQKEEAIKNAGDSDSAKKKIEQDYEKRRKEIEKRQFKSKQKMSIANIAIDTAQAIMSIASTGGGTGYSDYGITAGILIGITTALGAAQIAMVASQKPPSYFTGTDNAKEGLAWTQEKGAEIHTDRHGNIKTLGDNKGARLTKMSAGDIVYNAEETKRLMFQNDYNSLLTSNGILEPKVVVNSGITYAEMDEIVGRHIGNQPKHINNFDKAGFESYISKSGNITKNNSNRGQGIGQIV